ncbi:MAG: class I SAM-dependent methyltransferase [Pontixanthobacter sp.]
MIDARTLAFYEAHAPTYTVSGARGPSRDLDAFLDRLHPRAYILELGCGGGRDAQHVIARGFMLDATDGSAAMAKRARQRTGHAVRVMAFDALEAAAHYDAVWAHAALLHVARPDLSPILHRIARALRPGGLFYANYKLGHGEARDTFGRLYNFYDADALIALYDSVPDLHVETASAYASGGFDGVDRQWLAITARAGDSV